jgi:hypothetical protein
MPEEYLPRTRVEALTKQESISFLKKRNKKLLLVILRARNDLRAPQEKKFFGSFFQKRTASLSFASS